MNPTSMSSVIENEKEEDEHLCCCDYTLDSASELERSVKLTRCSHYQPNRIVNRIETRGKTHIVVRKSELGLKLVEAMLFCSLTATFRSEYR